MFKKLLIVAVALFAVYEYISVFMIAVTWSPWRDPRTFATRDDRGTFAITFLPDHRFLTQSNHENGACLRAGTARGSMGRAIVSRLFYVDCPGLIKFHVAPERTHVACVELATARQEGPGCQGPTQPTFYRVMSFSEDGSRVYDAGEPLQLVGEPDNASLVQIVDRLAPRSQNRR